jgi:dienelactone hydrolase
MRGTAKRFWAHRMRSAALALLPFSLLACGSSVEAPLSLRLTDSTALASPPNERLQLLTFLDAKGRALTGVLREPSVSEHAMPAVVLVAGRETGQQAAAVIPGPLQQAVLAIEYPEALPETFSPGAALRDLRAIRRTALRMPGLLRGAAAWLATRQSVDPGRIALVGVSYGVPFAAAASVDTLFRGVALHHGGADLGLLLRANLPVENGLLRAVLALWGAWYFRAIEPARYVGRIAPRPLLLINGTLDELVPRASAEKLRQAAGEPVRQIWLPHGHLMPDDFALMRELADSTLSYFEFLRAP